MAPSYKSRLSSRSAIKSSKTPKSSESSSVGMWVVLGLLLLLIIVVIFAGGFYKKFEKFTNPPTLKYFYMESCGYCNEFNPVWEDLKAEVKTKGINIILTKIDIRDTTKGADEAALYNVKGAPTIILDDINDKPQEYNGNRTLNDIIKFIEEKTKTT